MRKKAKPTNGQAVMKAAASDPRTPEECIEFVNKVIDTDNATRGTDAIDGNAKTRSQWIGHYSDKLAASLSIAKERRAQAILDQTDGNPILLQRMSAMGMLREFESAPSSTDETMTDQSGTKTNTKSRTRYPKDEEADELLTEAAKRSTRREYRRMSLTDIIRDIYDNGIGDDKRRGRGCIRMMYGKLKGKNSDSVRELSKPIPREKAVTQWAKHLSEFIKAHAPTYDRK